MSKKGSAPTLPFRLPQKSILNFSNLKNQIYEKKDVFPVFGLFRM